jgi:SPP1 family predicted phage head-tail adaptor
MPFPKMNWTVQNPGLANNYVAQRNKVRIRQPKGTVDAARATPPDFEDYLVGNGNGLYAEIQQPTPQDAILAFEQNVRITHSIKVRYDSRIKEDMQVSWVWKGVTHYARIHSITDVEYRHIWYLLSCVEQTTQAEAYQ